MTQILILTETEFISFLTFRSTSIVHDLHQHRNPLICPQWTLPPGHTLSAQLSHSYCLKTDGAQVDGKRAPLDFVHKVLQEGSGQKVLIESKGTAEMIIPASFEALLDWMFFWGSDVTFRCLLLSRYVCDGAGPSSTGHRMHSSACRMSGLELE